MPKSVAANLRDINVISDGGGEFFVMDKDPVIGWYFNDSDFNTTIEYETDGSTEGGAIIISQEAILFNQGDLVEFYGLYRELMDFWHELFPGKIYDINYEKLTTNQKDETKKLLEYCDLEWDENCLNFHTNKRAIKTASASQVRKKMYQGSSEDWKKYEQNIQPLIRGLSSY